jgi:hypothetical protein
MRITFSTLLLIFVFSLTGLSQTDTPYVAGFRASRILSSYPNSQFPNEDYWTYVGNAMASKFDSTGPAAVWIVSLYQSAGNTRLNFPSPGGTFPYILFTTSDYNETYLTRFDQEGFKVWLQVEPGAADMDTLISLVMNRYKHHSCVAGFGVDVEWLNTQAYSGGQHVTDSMAEHWENSLNSIDTNYTLFLKHYSYSWMPALYRGKILFVDDSQGFTGLTQMKNEYAGWGNHFSSNKVAFQFGYKADSTWWKQYTDPPLAIGNTLRSNIPNCYGLFWVDFTICQIFDISVNLPEKINDDPFKVIFESDNNCVNITGQVQDLFYEITERSGKIIRTGKAESQICFSDLQSGLYVLRIYNSKLSQTLKLPVQ